MMEGDHSQGRVAVVGIDDSEWSEKAFDYYLQNVYRRSDRLVVVYCVEPLHPPALPHAMASPEWKEHLDKRNQKTKEVQEKYRAKGEMHRLQMKIKVVSGSSAGAAICKEAKTERASIVVVGSRGAGIVRRTVLGSVSSYVVHHANVPVMVCPKPHSGSFRSPFFGWKKERPKESPRTEKRT